MKKEGIILLLSIIAILLIIVIVMAIKTNSFQKVMEQTPSIEKQEGKTSILDTIEILPEKIVYRLPWSGAAGNYFVFYQKEKGYENILTTLIKKEALKINMLDPSEEVSEQEMKQIQEGKEFVNLDYETQGYNYIIPFEQENKIIKLDKQTGKAVRYHSCIQEVENIKKLINENQENGQEVRNMSTVHTVKTTITSTEQLKQMSTMGEGFSDIFCQKIDTIEELNTFIQTYQLQMVGDMKNTLTREIKEEHCEMLIIASKKEMKLIKATMRKFIDKV